MRMPFDLLTLLVAAIQVFTALGSVSYEKRDDAAPTEIQIITVTAAPSIPSEAPQYVSDEVFTSAVLNSTNFFRAEHNATDVAYNETLAAFASEYLSDNENCDFVHSGGPYGENLAIGYADVVGAIDAWGNERDEYNFDDPDFDTRTGHFTQLVWRNTTDVGCGRKLCGERGWFLVCEYSPRGNILGAFGEAVNRPVNSSATTMMGKRGLATGVLAPTIGIWLGAAFLCDWL